MLLHKYNIDTCSSLQIGKDKNDNPLKIRIDKLTIVSFFLDKVEKDTIYSNLRKIRKIGNKRYSTKYIKNKEDMPYRNALLIKKNNALSPILLRIDYSPVNNNTGGIRFDFHPQHITAEEIDHMLSWMNKWLGKKLYKLLARAWVTQIDVALDVYGRRLHDYLWGLHRAGKTSYYNTLSGLPGIQLGSKRSILHILCYEKINLKRYKPIGNMLKAEHVKVNINKHKRFLRIEARFRPNAKPGTKDSLPLMLIDLKKMENPFQRLRIYSMDLLYELLPESSILTIMQEPSLVAFKRNISKNNQINRLPRKSISIINSFQINLFDTNKVWDKWHLCVRNLGNTLANLIV